MAVNIEVDEPEIDIRVRTYDGYVEATGIAAPLAVGDAQVGKGAVVDAGPVTTALLVGDAETTKGDTVEGGASTALVTGDGQTDKGSAVSAGGTSAQTVVGDAETDKGEATQAEGASAPLAVGNAQTEHLKPSYRWQMPLPRNLLDDPESFDPGSTAWSGNGDIVWDTYVDNVGPNGETAGKYDIVGTNPILSHGSSWFGGALALGFFVRAVSGTVNMSADLVFKDSDGNIVPSRVSGPEYTVDTTWTWVKHEDVFVDRDSGSTFFRVRLRPSDDSGSIYILRAGLNRGSSLHYTTRSSIEQTIPDTVQGADLGNGTDSTGPDTSDLSFGVDGDGIPYAVSDGDDTTSTAFDPRGPITVVANLAVDDVTDGERERWFKNYGFFVGITPNDYCILQLAFGGSGRRNKTYGAPTASEMLNNPVTIRFTIDTTSGFARLGVHCNNTLYSVTQRNASDLNTPSRARLTTEGAGIGFKNVEVHPALPKHKAEAVRKRLASNPPDPIPVTEAWDFTAETSPHNLIPNSESNWGGQVAVTSDTHAAPDGSITADTIDDTDSNSNQKTKTEVGKKSKNFYMTTAVWVKKESSGIFTSSLRITFKGNSFDAYVLNFDPVSGDVVSLDTNTSNTNFGGHVLDRGDYWRVVLWAEDANNNRRVRVNIAPRSGDAGNTGSLVVWGLTLVRGESKNPPYVKTTGSIAFPQRVPAKRQSSNDLTLGSTSGADTNDGAWIAPIGMAEDGDDQLRSPAERPVVTWIERVKYTATRAFGRSANGWKVTATDLVVEGTNGNTASAAHGQTIDDGAYHTLGVLIDEVAETAELYIDGATSPDATVDLSAVGTLKSSDVELLAEGGTIKQPSYYTRALSGEEIAYLHERLVDNPEAAYSEYTTP